MSNTLAPMSAAAKRAISMMRHTNRQANKRAAAKQQKTVWASDGIHTILVWHCEGGFPELLSAEKIEVPAPTRDAIEVAKLEGRFKEQEGHLVGINRFFAGYLPVWES